MTQKMAVRGLARMTGWIFLVWGAVTALKGLYDAFLGQPEANYFSPKPWEFVTREQWFRWAGFELAYGLACLGAGFAAWAYARRLPEFILREKTIEDLP
jgi:hypothetical protein